MRLDRFTRTDRAVISENYMVIVKIVKS